MGNCYSGDHITEDHIYMNITTCNTEEPQQTYRIGNVSKRSLGGGVKDVLLDPNHRH